MSYVATLTIPAGSVASTLTDFVTRVDLSTMPLGWWAAITQPDGREIRVRSAGVDIPFDLVRIDTTRQVGELFFKNTLTTSANVFTVEVDPSAPALATTDLATEILADSPALYWRLGESSGTTAADASGNGRTGTYTNAPTLGATGLTGDSNTAVNFDGTNDYVTRAETLDLTAFTLTAIVKPDITHPTTPGFIAGRINSTQAAINLDIYQGKIRAYIYNTSAASSTSTGGTQAYTVTAGTRYHIHVTYSAGTLKLYVNGALVGTDTLAGTFNGAQDIPFTVGARSTPDRYFDGTIDEVALFPTALSSTRVSAHYAAGAGTPVTQAQRDTWSGYDDVYLGSLTSRTGSGHNLSLTGGAMLSDWEVTGKSPNVSAHQGVARDAAGYMYVIGSNKLVKYDAAWSAVVSNTDPLGGTGVSGATHLSDGVVVGSELFAPFQNDANSFEYIGVWDTTTLAFKRSYNISATALDVSALTYNPADGLFYGTKYTETSTTVYKFTTSFVASGTLTLGSAISWMQGAVFSGGFLWVTSDMTYTAPTYEWRIYKIDPATGAVTEQWRGCLGNHLEGLTADADGNLYMLWDGLTDGAPGGVNSFVYTLTPAPSPWLCPGGLGYALAQSVPQRTQWTVGASGILGMVMGTNVGQCLWSYGISTTSNTTRASFAYYDQTDTAGIWNSTDTWLNLPANPGADGSRHRWHHTQNGTTDRKVWADGVLAATDTTVSQRPTTTGLMLGAEDTDKTQPWRGQLSYVYVRNGVVSADWIAAEYDSWENPASFYDVSVYGTLTATAPAATVNLTNNNSGAIAATAPPASVNAAGEVFFSAGLTVAAPAATVAIGGSVDSTAAGALTATAPAARVNIAGTLSGTTQTDTSNDYDGRLRDGLALVSTTVTVVVPANLGQRVDKAIAYPTPTLVDGRPT